MLFTYVLDVREPSILRVQSSRYPASCGDRSPRAGSSSGTLGLGQVASGGVHICSMVACLPLVDAFGLG